MSLELNFKNVIFDLGGVLIDWNPRYLYRKIFEREDEMEYFITKICNHDWEIHQDAGRSLADGTRILCQEHPDYAHLIKLYYERWPEMLNGEITQTVEIVKKLKAMDVNLYALTNWSYETFPYALKTFPCLQLFSDIVVSGREKVAKPNEKIFEILLTRNGLRADESIFIDDCLPNVEAARKIGFEGIHFTSPQDLDHILNEQYIRQLSYCHT